MERKDVRINMKELTIFASDILNLYTDTSWPTNKPMPPEIFASLPKPVSNRVEALKNLQFEHATIEAEFYQEIDRLYRKYDGLFLPLYERRKLITSAGAEITEQELNNVSKSDTEIGDANGMKEIVCGVPDFWKNILLNASITSYRIHECDLPIISHLTDIRSKLTFQNPSSLKLEFHFSPNEYFENSVLTKEYELKGDVEKFKFMYLENVGVIKWISCTIDWKKDKNATISTQEDDGILKTIQCPSFFNFFNSSTELKEVDANQEFLRRDFKVGLDIHKKIIPRAVLYYAEPFLEDDVRLGGI